MKSHLTTLILALMVLSFTCINGAIAQEAAPPATRYQDPLLTEAQRWATLHEPAVPRQVEALAELMPWSQLVFQSLQNHKDWNIYLHTPQGNQIQLTHEPSHEIHPRLNRSATHLLFASNRTGHFEIYRMNVDGSGLTPLTATGSDNLNPVWVIRWAAYCLRLATRRTGRALHYGR